MYVSLYMCRENANPTQPPLEHDTINISQVTSESSENSFAKYIQICIKERKILVVTYKSIEIDLSERLLETAGVCKKP